MHFPIGVFCCAGAVLVGGLVGTKLGKFIPERVSHSVTFIFGIISIVIGISLVTRIENLPAVVLALLIGGVLGEVLHLEDRVIGLCSKAGRLFEGKNGRLSSAEHDAKIARFLSALVMICTGINGLMGAMTEGFSGDSSLLFTKTIMDIFCSVTFASTVGSMIMLIAIPQFVLLMLLFLLSNVIIPFSSPSMIADFYACGGAISIITGLRITEVKHFPVINVLPALVLIMPISALWSNIAALLT